LEERLPSELEHLKARAEELARSAVGRPEARRARRLADRLDAGRFAIAVVGEFKRGKSTLVNALLGEAVLPTGVLPLTAIATELTFGEPVAVVEFLDGHAESIPRDELATYVTEAGNPSNVRGVARVEVRGPWSLLEPGVVLVDTPGLASLYQHNTEAGRAALLDADGAIVVLSADAPLSEAEHDLLEVLRDRRARTFFVVNKADHLGAADLAAVRAFVSETITDLLGSFVNVFAVDARSALAPVSSGRLDPSAGIEFFELKSEIWRFISDDLVTARVFSARNELARLGNALSEAIGIEQAARHMAAEDLAQLVQRFGDEAARQRQGFEDDRTLLARDVAVLLDDVGARLSQFAGQGSRQYRPALADIAASAPRSLLSVDLRRGVETAVERAFEDLRRTELAKVETSWNELAGRFRGRVQGRVDAARQAAANLFEVPLPRLEIPQLAAQRDRFSFLFIHVGSTTEPLSRVASRLVPSRWARRRALSHAEAELVTEFDKHAGRARWDLAQRLEGARFELEKAMRRALDESIEAIAEAADRARQRQSRTQAERERDDQQARQLERLGAELRALAGTT